MEVVYPTYKGREELLFALLHRPAASHLTQPNTAALFNMLPEPLITDRLAVVRRLTDQVNVLSIQMRPEEFTAGKAQRLPLLAPSDTYRSYRCNQTASP